MSACVFVSGTDKSRQPEGNSVSRHREKIRRLMLEKEHYTQKYLAEKRKYDMLLEKINSTSTLGSVVFLAEPHTIQPLVTNGTPRGSEENSGPSRSHRSLFKADIAPVNGDKTPPADSHELPASLLAAPRSSWSSDLSQEISPPPPIPTPSIVAPPAGIQPTPPNPHDPPRSSTKPPKRHEIARATKKTAKGAGIGLGVVLAAALFPISAPCTSSTEGG